MKKIIYFLLFLLPTLAFSAQDGGRTVINLNGTWQFDQTVNAFPPKKFTRTIPVPGLVSLATPKIEDYDKIFKPEENFVLKWKRNLYNINYIPRYNWYRKIVFIPKELREKEGIIVIKKSKYVTQVYINGMDMGTSMACFTPIEFPINSALIYGEYNEILIKVGDRVWLPSQAAGGIDKEKKHYIPGIWDDVLLSFTGNMRINRELILPSVKEKKVTTKFLLRDFFHTQSHRKDDSIRIVLTVMDSETGEKLGKISKEFNVKPDNISEVSLDVPIENFKLWTPDAPHLCTLNALLLYKGQISDQITKKFGMRDFTRQGKFFYLNGKKFFLRGTNMTLQRFFEDPDCKNLVWNRKWVKKLLIDIPKSLNWNTMRICVGIVPDFWYDLADKYGLMFQNEWMYWQSHGWNQEIKKEYTDWVWSDGSHPSIVIWDAINENYNGYIGNTLIPKLEKLDPTRIWDAGYMTGKEMANNEMDEPHTYMGYLPLISLKKFEKNPYPLGNLDYRTEINIKSMESSAAQLVNEYGWVWLWRNGKPARLTVNTYNYYVGKNTTPKQNREFQAYWLELETEWLRSQPYYAGVLSFCYLSNNYSYTGDWFINNIKDLDEGPTLHWFKYAFAPQAVFINLTDERYIKHQVAHPAGSDLLFTLYGINNKSKKAIGKVVLLLYDENGLSTTLSQIPVFIPAKGYKIIPANIRLPEKAGGYVLVAAYKTEDGQTVLSRRFLKVGEKSQYHFFDLKPEN